MASATPDDTGRPRSPHRRRRMPCHIDLPTSGLPCVSFSISTSLRPFTTMVPPVAYSSPSLKPDAGLLGIGLERPGLVVDMRDLEILRRSGANQAWL